MRVQGRLGLVAMWVLAVALAGCGKNGDPAQSSQPASSSQPAPAAQAEAPAPGASAAPAAPSAADYAKMAEQNRQALAQMNQGKVIEAVPAATLKDLLPTELPGLKRTSASAQRNQTMGVDISTAEGQYEATDGQGANVSLKLMDVSSMSGPMRMGMAGWAMAEFNRETDTGYEKTTTFNGYKALEEYNTPDKRGTVRVFVAERFIVEIEGEGIPMDTLKQMLGKVDVKKLAAAGS